MYGLTLVIGTKKIMASTVVFVPVVLALKHSISEHEIAKYDFDLNKL